MFVGVRLNLFNLFGFSYICMVYWVLNSWVWFMFCIWLIGFWILVVIQFVKFEWVMLLLVNVIIIRKVLEDLVICMFCCCIIWGRCGVVSCSLFCICIWVMFGLVLVVNVRVIFMVFEELLVEVIYSKLLMLFICCLIIWVIEFFIVFVEVFGQVVWMFIFGGVIVGYCFIGRL